MKNRRTNRTKETQPQFKLKQKKIALLLRGNTERYENSLRLE